MTVTHFQLFIVTLSSTLAWLAVYRQAQQRAAALQTVPIAVKRRNRSW